MSEPSELLRAYFSDRSESAFQALVERYLPLVYATALRKVGGNTTLAEEVSQDVFIVLARKGAALVNRRPLRRGSQISRYDIGYAGQSTRRQNAACSDREQRIRCLGTDVALRVSRRDYRTS